MILLNSRPFTVCTTTTNMLSAQSSSLENRHYGKTKMNQRSSRSHTIFRMVSKTTTYGDVQDSGEMLIFSRFNFTQILESRERSDPASGENADGAIIVSHLVSQLLFSILTFFFNLSINSAFCLYLCLCFNIDLVNFALSSRIQSIQLDLREQVKQELKVRWS